MALSKTHTLALYIALARKGKENLFKEILPGALLPDAIRCFGISRIITHFEKHYVTGEASGIQFPTREELKTLSKEKATALHQVNAKTIDNNKLDYEQVAIGDDTSLTAFEMMNSMLEKRYFDSISIHLQQDIIYDEYIREVIDCSLRRATLNFKFNGKVYDSKEIRRIISELEEQEFRYMCEIAKKEFGEEINQKWFENNVKPILFTAYCKEMAEKTWGFIKIDNDSPNLEHLPESQVDGIVSALIACSEKAIENF